MNFIYPMRFILTVWLGASFAGHVEVAAAQKDRPNVLLICVDDLKPVLGCYGDKTVRTPNIDRLAKSSVRFERAYCNQAVCAPSRNALMTGVRPTSMGIYDLGTNFRAGMSNAVTLSQYFMRHGYRAEGLGKIFHVGHGNHEDPASWSVPHFQVASIAYVLPESRARAGLTREEALFANKSAANLPRGAAYESADVPDDAYPDGKLAAEAIRRLQAAKNRADEPFFMAVGFVKPHLPFCAPKKYSDLYRRDQFKLPQNQEAPAGAPRYAPTSWGELRQYSNMPERGPVDDETARTLIHGYYAATSFVDAQIGRVLDELDRLELAENTIVVLWGDHGWHLGDHGMWCKHSNYEQANRIPLLIRAPGTKQGKSTEALAETVDIYPTLCDLAGLPAPEVPQKLEGTSLVPVLKRPSREVNDAVFHVFPRNRPGDGAILGRAVRTERYRLVEWKKPGAPADTAEYELYDYKKDPLESRNIADDEPRLVKKLRAHLDELGEAQPQIRAERRPRAGVNRGALFERRDENKDGKLTREEFLKGQPDPDEAPKRFPLFDSDKDGVLSREEYIAAGKR